MNTKALVLGAFLALVPFAIAHAQEGAPSETPVATEAETQTETEAAGKDSAAPQEADTAAPAPEATPDTAAVEETVKENAAEASAAESATAAATETVAKPAEAPAPSLSERIDEKFGAVVGFMAGILFVEVLQFEKVTELKEAASVGVPLIVLVLVFGALFFTVYHRFLNIRGFKHAIDVTRGKFDNPDDPGEISHFQALTSALSATVGLGNIAGVAVAVATGGPGAVFWMIILGLFGMSSKFHECTLAQIYRKVDDDGTIHGGPMYYLEMGLKERGLPSFVAKAFGVVFALFCIGGSFGGGNMFQANQAWGITKTTLESRFGMVFDGNESMYFGIMMAILVGLVIIGGIKRIGSVTEKIIPIMCGIYVLASLVILGANASELPAAVGLIFSKAFSFEAGIGGFVGIAIQGIKRAVFSNEAGIGSAAIAHSAAKTDEPVREGVVSLLEPFIDTVVICTMTALVVIVTGAWDNPEAGSGVNMTAWAFQTEISWFPVLLAVSVFLFAYSTMISWSYYGEKCFTYLFGRTPTVSLIYKGIFLVFTVIGSVASLGNVIDFSDLMILSMAFPNIIGGLILAPKIKEELNRYWGKLQNNEFKVYK